MLPPENRLRRSEDFRRTVRGGVRVDRPLVVVHLAAGQLSGGLPSKAGFVVSSSVGGAVVRNAVRRRLRHLLRDRLNRLPTGSTVVVRARAAATTARPVALAADLDTAFEQALRVAR